MTISARPLKITLLSGTVYFSLVALAHLLELKIPGLFIYFDVPSTLYQDKIISLLAFGWSMFFLLGYKLADTPYRKWILLHILSGAFAMLVFVIINTSGELKMLMGAEKLYRYWLLAGLLFIYLLILLFTYLQAVKKS